MRQGRHNQAVHIAKNLVHGFACQGRRGWELRFQIARFNLRQYRQVFDMFEVVRNPVDQFVTVPAKLFGIHVAQRR